MILIVYSWRYQINLYSVALVLTVYDSHKVRVIKSLAAGYLGINPSSTTVIKPTRSVYLHLHCTSKTHLIQHGRPMTEYGVMNGCSFRSAVSVIHAVKMHSGVNQKEGQRRGKKKSTSPERRLKRKGFRCTVLFHYRTIWFTYISDPVAAMRALFSSSPESAGSCLIIATAQTSQTICHTAKTTHITNLFKPSWTLDLTGICSWSSRLGRSRGPFGLLLASG